MTLTPGADFGAYHLIGLIRHGGMAAVYKAYQPALSRYVAIKVLPAFLAEEEGFQDRFKREAVAIGRLRHPNILAVFECGNVQGLPYLATEYVDGGELSEQLGAPLPVSYVVRMLAPIASALDYAHGLGVLHRDIKPSNIFLERSGKPVLGDFGIAKLVDSTEHLTRTGTILGTPEYMAPEQAVGEEFVPSSDQYALAIVAYEMLTGRVPFSGHTPMAVLIAHMQKALPPPRSINPALTPAVEAVLLKGLAKRPQERYRSVYAFIAALALAGRVELPAEPEPVVAAGRGAGPGRPPAAGRTREGPARAGRLPSAAFALYLRRPGELLARSLALYLPFMLPYLLLLGALRRGLAAGGFAPVAGALVTAGGVAGSLFIAGIIAGALAIPLSRIQAGLTVAPVHRSPAPAGRWLPLLGSQLLAGAILLLLTLSVVGIPLAVFLWSEWSLAGPVAVIERTRGGTATLRRSGLLVRGHWGRTLAALLPVLAVWLLLAALLAAAGGNWSTAPAIAALLFAALIGGATMPYFGALTTLIFHEYKARNEGSDAAPAWDPAAQADTAVGPVLQLRRP